MEEYGLIVLITGMALFAWVGRYVGYDSGVKEGMKAGYKHGLEDGRRMEKQAQERALARIRVTYGDDTKVYEKRA